MLIIPNPAEYTEPMWRSAWRLTHWRCRIDGQNRGWMYQSDVQAKAALSSWAVSEGGDVTWHQQHLRLEGDLSQPTWRGITRPRDGKAPSEGGKWHTIDVVPVFALELVPA